MEIACCEPLLEEPVTPGDAVDLASRFKALADPGRIRLLSLIARRGSVCACELVGIVDLSQPTISHHLKVLADAGLLAREKRGRWVHYWVDAEAMSELSSVLAVPIGA
jgi:ArsR family transcriptional regulator